MKALQFAGLFLCPNFSHFFSNKTFTFAQPILQNEIYIVLFIFFFLEIYVYT